MVGSCGTRFTNEEQLGVSFCIEAYARVEEKTEIPAHVNLNDDKAVMHFISDKLTMPFQELKATRFGCYLIVNSSTNEMDVVKTFMNSCVINIYDRKMVTVFMARS